MSLKEPTKAPSKRAPRKAKSHLDEVHEAELLVENLELTRTELRTRARKTLGVDGSDASVSMSSSLKEHGVTLYPVGALGLLAIVDQFQGQAFTVLTPEMARSLGLSL